MADQIREARRRKILENRENRLQRILGLTEKNEGSESNSTTEPDKKTNVQSNIEQKKSAESESLTEVSHSKRNIYPQEILNEPPSELFDPDKISKTLFNLDESAYLNGKAPEEQRNWAGILVLIAITSITILYTNYGLLIGNNVLIPFLVFEAYIYGFATGNILPSPPSSLVNTVLLLSGLPQQTLNRFTKFFWMFQTVVQDLCVYLFACLMCYQLYIAVL